MSHDVVHTHALEVVNLASAHDGGQNLMLLSGGENEDGMLRRFFQCLQEGIEGGLLEHVHLVDDKHLVFANLRRYAHLLN